MSIQILARSKVEQYLWNCFYNDFGSIGDNGLWFDFTICDRRVTDLFLYLKRLRSLLTNPYSDFDLFLRNKLVILNPVTNNPNNPSPFKIG
ncbi:hypothetical protein [Nostoc sp. C110]|uniref:hypothetical protein n=1 Tax=Nostoc sp. C110 TaxID=3349876 RepID=UPI00370DA331